MNRFLALLSGIGLVLAALVGCSGSDLVLPSDTSPGDISLFLGNNQSGPAGTELVDPLVVKVLDRRGQPLPNQRVAFGLAAEVPGARITPDTAETDAEGHARARWVLGSVSGPQAAVARVVGVETLEVTFTATVGAAGASRIETVSGGDQAAPVGTELPDPLIVRVVDGFGNGVEGATVSWSADEGSVSPTESVTGQDGQAAASWTLGPASGLQAASASSPGVSGSVSFTATAQAGGADRLLLVSGDGQSARPGSAVGNPLVVRLLDNAGNGVPDRPVSWVVATGGGSVQPGTSITDDEGRASTQWTLGPGEGSNTLNAVVSGVGFVGFSATATNGGGGGGGGGARRLEFLVQPSDTEEDRRISPPVEVVVLDQSGNRVTDRDFEVKLELVRTGRRGRLNGDSDRRTQAGVARFSDLEVDREGEYRLRASADGLPSVDSNRFEIEDD